MKVQNGHQEEELSMCPYDNSHTFAKHKYVYHIHRCGVGKKYGYLFRNCRYNPLHIITKEQIDNHQMMCQDRKKAKDIVKDIQEIRVLGRQVQDQRLRDQQDRRDTKSKQQQQEKEEQMKDQLKIQIDCEIGQQQQQEDAIIQRNNILQKVKEQDDENNRIQNIIIQGWQQQEQKQSDIQIISQPLEPFKNHHCLFKDPLQKCKQCLYLLEIYLQKFPVQETLIKTILYNYYNL